jgi:hypothetical protein
MIGAAAILADLRPAPPAAAISACPARNAAWDGVGQVRIAPASGAVALWIQDLLAICDRVCLKRRIASTDQGA